MNRRVTAVAIIVAALLTNTGFSVLGSVFEYPAVLKQPAHVVLERFREHQSSVSLWFAALAVSAALFAPIAIGVGKLRSDAAMRRAVPMGIAAAIVQTIGLSRWPLLVPSFAAGAASSDSATVANAEAHFHTAGLLLGTVVGETLGYTFTAAWTLLVVKSLGASFSGRAFVWLGAISATMILAGVLSPLNLAAIDKVNFAGYVLWSIWLIWLAVVLLRGERAS